MRTAQFVSALGLAVMAGVFTAAEAWPALATCVGCWSAVLVDAICEAVKKR